MFLLVVVLPAIISNNKPNNSNKLKSKKDLTGILRTNSCRQEQAEQARQSMLTQILTPEARDRLHRISLVKPDRARYLEDSLIQAVRSGQLRGGSGPGGKISEGDLIGMLEELGEQEEKRKTKIVFQRRRDLSDSDDDY